MTTNSNLAEFEPTDEMKARWPGIGDKTTIKMTNARRIDVPTLMYRPSNVIQTDGDEPAVAPYFALERLDLIRVGSHLCYYQDVSDALYVQR